MLRASSRHPGSAAPRWLHGQARASPVPPVADSDRAQAAEALMAGRYADAFPAERVQIRREGEVVDLQQRPQRGNEHVLRPMPHAVWSPPTPLSVVSGAGIVQQGRKLSSHNGCSAALAHKWTTCFWRCINLVQFSSWRCTGDLHDGNATAVDAFANPGPCAGAEGAQQSMVLTGSVMICDSRSSGKNVMLRSGAAVDRSHACCWAVIAVRNTTLTGTPVDKAAVLTQPEDTLSDSGWVCCKTLALARQVGPVQMQCKCKCKCSSQRTVGRKRNATASP